MGGWTDPTDIPAAEAAALKWLYDNTDGPNWTTSTNWGQTATAANWFGITLVGGKVTRIVLGNNNLVGNIGGFAIGDFTTLQRLQIESNASMSGDISGWSIPATLQIFYLNNTLVSGDVSGWTMPNSLIYTLLHHTSISGDLSSWDIPTSAVWFELNQTSVSGDISGWTLPAGLVYLYLNVTSVSGSIAGWTIPAALQRLYLYSTSLSNTPVMTSMAAIREFYYQGCRLSEAHVDAVCLALYTEWATGALTYATPALSIGGTNAAPSGAYADEDPPSTGLGAVYEICNDPETTGYNTWTASVTGSGPYP